jgi:hypothetical protein
MLILLLVVLLVPGLILLALGSVGYGSDRPGGPDRRSDRVQQPATGELPELLRRPLRARAE